MAREMYTPQLVVVEFGEEDVVVCSNGIDMNGNGSLDIGNGDDGEDPWE